MYDKQAAHIGYTDSTHTYTNIKNQHKYTSVTTLIHKFVPPFKTKYWSLYKAIKDTLPVDMFARYKKAAGGWDKVVKFYQTNSQHLTSHRDKIYLRQQYYIKLWDKGRDEACALGTAIHNELEDAAHHSQHLRNKKAIYYEVSQENILALQDFTSTRIYPELLVYSDKYMVAGQIDGVFKSGRKVDLFDYKTCKSIDTEAFRGETLLTPFTNIPNANYYIYQLQLSIYGYLLELNGYQVGSLELHWIYGDNPESNVRDKIKTYNIEYKPITARKILEQNIN